MAHSGGIVIARTSRLGEDQVRGRRCDIGAKSEPGRGPAEGAAGKGGPKATALKSPAFHANLVDKIRNWRYALSLAESLSRSPVDGRGEKPCCLKRWPT